MSYEEAVVSCAPPLLVCQAVGIGAGVGTIGGIPGLAAGSAGGLFLGCMVWASFACTPNKSIRRGWFFSETPDSDFDAFVERYRAASPDALTEEDSEASSNRDSVINH